MSMDLSRITEQINALWAAYGHIVIVLSGGAVVVLAFYTTIKIVRSPRRDRWVGGLTALVVLAWTSEGLWEVAYGTLGLPLGFAVMTFFVYEAMMLTAALQAERHRKDHPSPGPAGRYVWVLASVTASIVALNANTPVEAMLRFSLPLAAAGLWWVGITAEREDDPDEVKRLREAERKRREAIWAFSWRRVLVAVGIMRPGKQTLTEAERERRINQMVTAADRLHGAKAGSWKADRAANRLRRLARLASANDVAAVRARVTRATRIANLVLPDDPEATDNGPASKGDATRRNGQGEHSPSDLLHATTPFHPDAHRSVAGNGAASPRSTSYRPHGPSGHRQGETGNGHVAGDRSDAQAASQDRDGGRDRLLRETVRQLYLESLADGQQIGRAHV